MYHNSCLYGSQVQFLRSLVWTRVLIPVGDIGLQLKQNILFNSAYSERLGLCIEGCRK